MTYDRAQMYLRYSTENPGNISPERWRAILIAFGINPNNPAPLADSDSGTQDN